MIAYYANEIKLDCMLMLNQNILPTKQLRDIVQGYDSIYQKSGLTEIKPKKGKVKKIIEERRIALDSME